MANGTVPGAPSEPAGERSRLEPHRVSFQKNIVTGHWAAVCAGCGWFLIRDEDEVKRRAAGHDLEWVPADDPPGQFEVAAALRDEREGHR